jgi:CheY-like chemotaxis protein
MKKKILIIEDDPPIRETLTELLEEEGFIVACAGNGEQGLAWLRANEHPNLILLDLMMPVKDGFEFRTDQMQDPSLKSIPVVIMSADAHVEQKAGRLGGVGFIRKPPDIDEVLGTIAKHIS